MDIGKFNPIGFVKNLSDEQKKNILTGIAKGSIPVTAVLSGVAGVKLTVKLEEYKEREKAGEDIPLKIKILELGWILFPPVTTAVVGEVCIDGINRFNAAEVAALTAIVANHNRKDVLVDKKLREELGEEKAKEFKDDIEKKAKSYDPLVDPDQLIIDRETGREFYAPVSAVELALEKAKVEKLGELTCWSGEELQLSLAELYEFFDDELIRTRKPLDHRFINIGWEGKDCIQYLHVEFEPSCSSDGRRAGWEMSYSTEPRTLTVIQ